MIWSKGIILNKYTNNFIFNKNVYYYCDLKKIFEKYPLLRKLPNSAKILLESNIRNAKEEDISSIISTFIHRNYLNKIEFNWRYIGVVGRKLRINNDKKFSFLNPIFIKIE